ncbi:MAG: mechanosensitive ion channel family protein [Oligoflexia bacterium]|nr:mechanosensitive ion channel family protein [Oligoflexia bacterium]
MDFPSELLTAAGVFGIMLLLIALVRAGLRAAVRNRNWAFLAELASPISNLIYVAGVKLLADLAPLPDLLRRGLDGTLYVAVVLMLLWIVRKAGLTAIEWNTRRSAASKSLQHGFIPLLSNVLTLFVFLTGGIMILRHFGYDVMSLVTALGVGSLAIGLAAKDTLSNMISGFILIVDRNLKPGDLINLSGAVGAVEEIGLRSTRIRTSEGNMLIVPNAELVNTRLLNLSTPTTAMGCSTQIRVPYHATLEEVRRLCLECMTEVPAIRVDRPRSVLLASLADGVQTVNLNFWVDSFNDQAAAQSELLRRVLTRLQEQKLHVGAPPPSAA